MNCLGCGSQADETNGWQAECGNVYRGAFSGWSGECIEVRIRARQLRRWLRETILAKNHSTKMDNVSRFSGGSGDFFSGQFSATTTRGLVEAWRGVGNQQGGSEASS